MSSLSSSLPSVAEPEPAWAPQRIDVAPFLSDGDTAQGVARAAVARRLRDACVHDGLFLVELPSAFASGSRILPAMGRFFALPEEAKRRVPLVHEGGFTRGYIPLFGESGLRARFKELKEGFSYGYPWEDEPGSPPPGNPLQGPNIWPSADTMPDEEERRQWRATLLAFYADMVAVAEALCRALSMALGRTRGEDVLGAMCRGGGETISLMRAFHYLPVEELPEGVDPSAAIGSSPHTDWGFLTLILQDGTGGLQVRRRRKGAKQQEEQGEDGSADAYEWVDVPAVEDCLVVNCGDFLSLLSTQLLGIEEGGEGGGGGRKEDEEEDENEEYGDHVAPPRRPFHSPVHRVALSSRSRTSLVFFYYPRFDTPLLPQGPQQAAGQREGEGGGGERGDGSYNTLLDLPPSSSSSAAATTPEASHGVTFGEHLVRKWAGVRSA